MAALLGVTAMVYGRYEKGSLAISEKVAAKAASMVEKESVAVTGAVAEEESVETVPATGAVDDMAEEADSVEQAVADVAEQAVDTVTEKEKAEKPVRKDGRKTGKSKKFAEKVVEEAVNAATPKNATPQILIESKLGGQISTSEILSRVPVGVDKIFIKPEENKAYWIKGDETGDVELWG